MRITDNFVCFWGGEFSNWYKSPFIHKGIEFNCAEQYMMYKKAEMFNDKDSMEKVLRTKNPRDQKALGRLVKNFDQKTWEESAVDIMIEGLLCKFRQNKTLEKILLDTNDKIIVEASLYDIVWGVGMSVDDPNIEDPSKWKGKNLLGITLMKTREILKFLT